MKRIYFCLILIFFSFQNSISAQKVRNKENYNVPIREEKGDLNGDGKRDKVTVFMDTINKTVPLRMQIFLSQPNGKLKLVVSSTQIIEAQYPIEKKGKYNELQKSEGELLEKINETKLELGQLKNSARTIEKYAREKYLMKKDNEDLFIVADVKIAK